MTTLETLDFFFFDKRCIRLQVLHFTRLSMIRCVRAAEYKFGCKKKSSALMAET